MVQRIPNQVPRSDGAKMNLPECVRAAAKNHPHPLLFATVSGAHLYGFPSPDSDYDLRGVHILPLEKVIGLGSAEETVESARIEQGIELDLVTHDIKKFFLLMLKKNGYVLEQLYSPIVVQTTEGHSELKEIGKRCITRHHSHHYMGFAATQWKLLFKEQPHRVKPLLYVFRVLLTGIHLMRTGTIEANLATLASQYQQFGLTFIPELISRKVTSREQETLPESELEFYEREYIRLLSELENASAQSTLPESPSAREDLDDLLKRVRLAQNV